MAKIQKNGTSLDVLISTVNPQNAKSILAKYKRNRRLSPARVRRYAQAMKMGEWEVAQPILISNEGMLIDGQHRLHAVVAFGGPVDFIVIRGFNWEKTFGRVDEIAARKLKDWFEIHGEPLPAVLATVVSMSINESRGWIPTMAPAGRAPITPIEGVEFLAKHPEIREAVVEAPATVSVLASRSMLSFAYYKFRQSDKTLARSFLIDLATGSGEGHGDPIFLLRERLKSNRQAKTKMHRTEMLALIFKAWNAVKEERTFQNIRWRSSGPQAEKFPVVL